jgi:hypothetical protein
MATARAVAVAAGAASALLYLSVLPAVTGGALILGYLTPLPLFLAGFQGGNRAVVLAGLTGLAAILAVSGNLLVTASYIVSSMAPAILVVRQSLLARTHDDGHVEWYPPGLLLTGLTSLGLAALVVAALVSLGEPGGLEGAVRDALDAMAGRFAALLGDTGDAGRDAVGAVAMVLPSMVVLSWLTMVVINAALAQGLLMRFGRNRRPAMRMAGIDLPHRLTPVLAVAAAGAVLLPGVAGYLAFNTALILAFPFAFAGLAVMHAFAARQPARVAILVGFYVFLFLFGWPIPLVAGLGVIEQWTGLRRRMLAGSPDREDE